MLFSDPGSMHSRSYLEDSEAHLQSARDKLVSSKTYHFVGKKLEDGAYISIPDLNREEEYL
jgi:hypothetical protein